MLGFHEDGADPVRLLKEGYSRAQDDFLTFSLFADAGLSGNTSIRLGARHHLLTDRAAGERLDLGILGASFPLSSSRQHIRPMLGVLALGSLGGQKIQNVYHRLGNHPILDLDTADASRVCALAGLELRVATEALPFQLVAGLAADHDGWYRRGSLLIERSGQTGSGVLGWRVQLGGKVMDSRSDLIASALGSGFWAGLDLSWQLKEDFSLCSWVRPGASRSDQSLLGLALAFGSSGMPDGPF